MSSLDTIFAKEFKHMAEQRRAESPNFSLEALALPKSVLQKCSVENHHMTLIRGISDPYYSKLNDTEALIWSRPNLCRRMFGSDGKFLMENGKYKTESITLPQDSLALISPKMLGVPLKYSTKESFQYVDYISRTNKDGSTSVRYIYIVPRHYCYKLNQVALVLSLDKLRLYYEGMEIYLQNGYVVYMYIVPYTPRKSDLENSDRTYRVIATKTTTDFKSEIDEIVAAWQRNNIIFPYNLTQLNDEIKGRTNVAYYKFNTVRETHVRFDPTKSMASVKEDMDFGV